MEGAEAGGGHEGSGFGVVIRRVPGTEVGSEKVGGGRVSGTGVPPAVRKAGSGKALQAAK